MDSEHRLICLVDFTFAKFNKPVKVIDYTPEEYELYFRDGSWTKEETDHLWELCHRFDLRFIVMADRWTLSTSRTVDDMKERYYSVSKKVLAYGGYKLTLMP
jgi:DNA methyltransferase 1-associated protein 1